MSRGSQEAVDRVSWEGDRNSSPHSGNFPVLNLLCLWFMGKLRIASPQIPNFTLSPVILESVTSAPTLLLTSRLKQTQYTTRLSIRIHKALQWGLHQPPCTRSFPWFPTSVNVSPFLSSTNLRSPTSAHQLDQSC